MDSNSVSNHEFGAYLRALGSVMIELDVPFASAHDGGEHDGTSITDRLVAYMRADGIDGVRARHLVTGVCWAAARTLHQPRVHLPVKPTPHID